MKKMLTLTLLCVGQMLLSMASADDRTSIPMPLHRRPIPLPTSDSGVIDLKRPRHFLALREQISVPATCQRNETRIRPETQSFTVYDMTVQRCASENQLIQTTIDEEAYCTYKRRQVRPGINISVPVLGTIVRFKRDEAHFDCVDREDHRRYLNLEHFDESTDLGQFVTNCKRIDRDRTGRPALDRNGRPLRTLFKCDVIKRELKSSISCRNIRTVNDAPSCIASRQDLPGSAYNQTLCVPQVKTRIVNVEETVRVDYPCTRLEDGPTQVVQVDVRKAPARDENLVARLYTQLSNGQLQFRAAPENNAQIFLVGQRQEENRTILTVDIRNIKSIDDAVFEPITQGYLNYRNGKLSFEIAATADIRSLNFSVRMLDLQNNEIINKALEGDDFYVESSNGRFEVVVDLRRVLKEDGEEFKLAEIREEGTLKVFVTTSLNLGTMISTNGLEQKVPTSTRRFAVATGTGLLRPFIELNLNGGVQ